MEEQNGIDVNRLSRVCPDCFQYFPTRRERDRHSYLYRHFGPKRLQCPYCYSRFVLQSELNEHLNEVHLRNYQIWNSAFQGRFQYIGRSFSHYSIVNLSTLVTTQAATHHSILDGFLYRFNAIQCQMHLHARFAKLSPEGTIQEIVTIPVMTRVEKLFAGMRRFIPKVLRSFYRTLSKALMNVQLRGSNLVLLDIVSCSMRINKAVFAGGGGGSGRKKRRKIEPLDDFEQRYTVDVETEIPNGCIYASIAQHFLNLNVSSDGDERRGGIYGKNTQRYLRTKLWLEQSGMKRISSLSPVCLDEIKKLERLNKGQLDFAINVFGKASKEELEIYDGDVPKRNKWRKSKKIYVPLYISPRALTARHRISLLLNGSLRDPSEDLHFVYIANLEKLMGLPESCLCCFYCLNSIKRSYYSEHLKRCSRFGGQRVILPQVNERGEPPTLEFRPGRKRFLSPICAVSPLLQINN